MSKYQFCKEKEYILYQGKMQDVIDNCIEENSIDSIITDPPYELNFMGKGWDNSGVAFQKETWERCYKALKPGGYLLAFGGSRTFHRIACAIEDAGFEIRDTIMWLYGMGFPKSQNIGKQLEKRLEDEKTKQNTEHDLRLMWERDLQKTKRNEKKQVEVLQSQLQEQSLQSSINSTSDVWREEPCLEGWNNIQKTEGELQRCKVCEMSKRVSINGEERWVCNGTQISDGKTLREMFEQSGSCTSYRPQSEQQQDRKLNAIQEQCRTQESREIIEYWNKFGTCLKPAFEPIIVARKPFKGSLVDNVLEYGVGGLNIDECRVETNEDIEKGRNGRNNKSIFQASKINENQREYQNNGRFPANVILTYDENDFDEVCGGFPNTKSNGGETSMPDLRDVGKKSKEAIGIDKLSFGQVSNVERKESNYIAPCDSGSASRYFYCAKASKKDRDEGLDKFEEKQVYGNDMNWGYGNNNGDNLGDRIANVKRKNTHPTVKPVELMQYLIRLVTPKNGVIMDCFMGSGSTGKAVMFENRERNANYKFIGIEMTEEYLPICHSRIDYALNKYEYDEIKQRVEEHKLGIQNIFDFM